MSDSKKANDALIADTSRYNEQYNILAAKMMAEFVKNSGDENIFYSPFSVIVLLSIATDSVDGKTREEILDVIGGDISFEDLREMIIKLQDTFAEGEDMVSANVITCAAPNLRLNAGDVFNTIKVEKIARISDGELSAMFEKRVDRIIATAAAEDNDVLILGAFGCGAFCNPPEIVARAFHKVLDGYIDCFETVEFAVCCTDHETDNFKAFKKEFG